MADDLPDDDATRIYRPYGSPPPDAPATETADASSAPDPFAPDPFASDPFAPAPSGSPPDPFAPAPLPASPASDAAPDPFAPDSPPTASADPFAPDPASAASSMPDPFAPAPSEPDELATDPFRPPPTAEDPFAAPPSPAPPTPPATPFSNTPAAPDPFAPSAPSAPESPSAPDPFASPAASSPAGRGRLSPDPFAAPISDPFAAPPASAPADPFAPPSPTPTAPSAPADPSPFDLSAPDPFAAPPPLPSVDPVPARAADPFTAAPGTNTDDPFADLQGPSSEGGASYADDSRVHATGARAEVDLPDVFSTERTLAGAFTPVFSLILQIRASQHLGDPTALRQRVEALLSDAARSARELGVSDADTSEAEFCLVAFLDEAILGSDWPGRDAWSAQPLQLTHYDRYDAGEWFFDRLKALLDEGGTRTAVLEVYYLCLALGFKGRYAIHGREVLRRLVDDLYGRLERASGVAGALAPRGTSREVAAEAEKGGIPSWALWIGAAALVALLYLGLSLSLSGVASETAEELQTLQTSSS